MTRIAAAGNDTAAVLAVTASEARALTGADAAMLELLDREGLVCAGAADGTAVRVGRPLERETLSWRAIQQDEAIHCDDLRPEARGCDGVPLGNARSAIASPFTCSERVNGVITVHSDKAGAFGDEDIATVTQLSRFVANQLELARRYEDAHRTSRRDPLTGLGNRRALDETLVSELGRRARYGGALSICLFDLDGFKTVNDTAGHLAGDRVLARVAQRLSDVRGADSAFRLGGDEFALVMPETPASSAELVARRLAHLVRDDAEAYGTTASWGIVEATDASTAESLLAAADDKLYARKRAGHADQASA